MIRALIFDCYGVLYPDTFWTLSSRYLGDTLEIRREELHALLRQVDLGMITRDELWKQFSEIVGVDVDAIYNDLKDFSGLDARLLEFIERVKQSYKIGMISNVGHGFIERMFTEQPAEHYFDSIVLSSDVGLLKPDPRIYELAAQKLQVEPNACIFFDDLEKNVNGAIAAGMSAVQYTTFERFILEIDQLLSSANTNK